MGYRVPEVHVEANEAVRAVLTAYHFDPENTVSVVADVIDRSVEDPEFCGALLGALAGIAYAGQRRMCDEAFGGDWPATMANLAAMTLGE